MKLDVLKKMTKHINGAQVTKQVHMPVRVRTMRRRDVSHNKLRNGAGKRLAQT